MWVLIDNYDSFTYILHHYLLLTGNECLVVRNDEITAQELRAMSPERIIISPGPETPLKAGICMEVIDQFHRTTPILGVCLGHQALGMYFGAILAHATYPVHGKTSTVIHEHHPIFQGVSEYFQVMRYHSLVIEDVPESELTIIARTQTDGVNMAMAHRQFPSIGIQFHPESISTTDGLQILKNWACMYTTNE